MILMFLLLTLNLVTPEIITSKVFSSTPFSPTTKMPDKCFNPKIVEFISSFKGNFNDTTQLDFPYVKPVCYSWNESTDVVSVEETCYPEINKNYVWKELSKTPLIGITYGIPSEHLPHYHNEDECYYVWMGNTKTLSQDKMVDLLVYQYLYIPSNHIHTTPILTENFGVVYWFPNYYPNDDKELQYYWKHNCPEEYKELFPSTDSYQ
jgi:hypothetical protein